MPMTAALPLPVGALPCGRFTMPATRAGRQPWRHDQEPFAGAHAAVRHGPARCGRHDRCHPGQDGLRTWAGEVREARHADGAEASTTAQTMTTTDMASHGR